MPNRSASQHAAITRLPVQKINATASQHGFDEVVVEEPLEIRLVYGPAAQRTEQSVSVTMRTPGNDEELARGFLFTEGIIPNTTVILSENHGLAVEPGTAANVIRVALDEHLPLDLNKLQRHFYTSSSCGVCGKSSIDAIKAVRPPYLAKELLTREGESSREEIFSFSRGSAESADAGWRVGTDIIYALPGSLHQHQEIFKSTGGLHAAALFDLNGNLLSIREDIGRHNAVDKVIGLALRQGLLPLQDHILLLSGRACFELIQKAAMAGITVIAAVGPPSSLAVQLAEEYGITLIGFLREGRFNIYTGAQRVYIGTQRVQNLHP